MGWITKEIDKAVSDAVDKEISDALEGSLKRYLPTMVASALCDIALDEPERVPNKVGFINMVAAFLHIRHGWEFDYAKRVFVSWMQDSDIKYGDDAYGWTNRDAEALADELSIEASTW